MKIFISHSSKDFEKWANRICVWLEQQNTKCWISERDLDRTRSDWPDELMQAIKCCSKVLLILSKKTATGGNEVRNEIANASSLGKEIIPVVVEDGIPIPDNIMYFIRGCEWIDFYNHSFEEGINIILKRVGGKTQKMPKEKAMRISVHEYLTNVAPCFFNVKNSGICAGFDKCILENGAFGWNPRNVKLEYVDMEDFHFTDVGLPKWDEEYKAYCLSAEYQRIVMRGNDRTRWMLNGIYQNDNIFLCLKKTKWSVLSFWWNKVRDNPSKQAEMAEYVFNQSGAFFPNSLCLHLIVETFDNQLVCTQISRNKSNDYGSTIAVTIGEQISASDFIQQPTNNDQFLLHWCKRALMEEFNFSNDEYTSYVNESSIRVLGLSYEGDIYNFALPVYLQLNITFEDLQNYFSSKPKNCEEFTTVTGVSFSEVVNILSRMSDGEIERQYHPSSFLRMLLYAIYKQPSIISSSSQL